MKKSGYYDKVFTEGYAGDKGAFDEIHKEMAERYTEGRLLDIGCGTGNFLKQLKEKGVVGDGLDFSRVGIEKAEKKCPESQFFLEEALQSNIYDNYEVFAMSEFLEHIEEDRELLMKLPKGKKVIVSVPTFDWISHVRFFPTEESITERYKDILEINSLVKKGGNYIFNGITK